MRGYDDAIADSNDNNGRYGEGYRDGIRAERERWLAYQAQHEAMVKAIAEFAETQPRVFMLKFEESVARKLDARKGVE
jgi:hypothetical protein